MGATEGKTTYARMTKEGQQGLFKKVSEGCVLCAVEMAIIVLSPRGKPFNFGHPSADAAQTDRDQTLEKLNKQYADVLEQLKVGAEELNDIKVLRFEKFSLYEFLVFGKWLEDVEKAVDKRRTELLASEASSSTPCPRAIDASIISQTNDKCGDPRKSEAGNE
ncbi:hypothetical protein BT93_D0871 [Corymbia citriodora subsp. variegata]|nr:hypothetical protein BT93_D0871 [Corymbia citriodora subsp. variegata]